jgi:DnaJ family protein A protein 2
MQVDDEDDLELDPLQEPLPADVQEEEMDLEDVDQNGARRAQGATMDDEDEDGVPHGAERVQCASQ